MAFHVTLPTTKPSHTEQKKRANALFSGVVRHSCEVEITPSNDLTEDEVLLIASDEVLLIASIETHTRTDKAGNVTVTTTIKLQDRQRAWKRLRV